MKRANLLLISLLTISCQQPDMNFRLTAVTPLENIPGASGLGVNEKHIYIIGDNSPYLYQLDHTAKPLDLIPIYLTDDFKNGKIAKKIKPDFEAMELIKGETYDEILIFGSGSRGPQRDIFIHITLSPEPHVKTYNLINFYDQIRELQIMDSFDLNIEDVALHKNKMLLFNRGKNLMLTYDYPEFLRFLEDGMPYPSPDIKELELPQINGLKSGFSGATMISGTQTILFTASVEDAPNAYDDGKMLGSFIGMINLDRLDEKVKYFLIEDGNQPMSVKIESVAILNQIAQNELEILMVTDSDGDESLLLKGILTW